jgi:tryptophan halogenase
MSESSDKIDDIIVVGGGDNGVLAALLLQKLNQDVQITIIDDFDEEPPKIGKSTYSNVQGIFHDLLDFDRQRFFSEVKPVWKVSICFADWCGNDRFHIPFDDAGPSPQLLPDEQGEEMYHRYHTDNFSTLGTSLAEKQKSPFPIGCTPDNPRIFDHHAYHLSISRFNKFLRTVSLERGISLENDRICNIETIDNRIDSISSKTSTYEADLYIDATGFNRVLIEELDTEFTEFEIPLDSALVSKSELAQEDITPSTIVNSAEYGWMWQIDTCDFRDVGYVYASDYTNREAAVREFIDAKKGITEDSEIIKYEFESGYLDEPWVNNCVAVGNAAGFIEPLQATTLSFSAELAKNLSEMLSKHSRLNYPEIRSLYNSVTQESWEELYSFISLHYIYSGGDGKFWNKMQNIKPNKRLQEYVESYRNHGFHAYREFYENVDGPSDAWVTYLLLYNLGVKSNFYEQHNIPVRSKIKKQIDRQQNKQTQTADQHMSYEEALNLGFHDSEPLVPNTNEI